MNVFKTFGCDTDFVVRNNIIGFDIRSIENESQNLNDICLDFEYFCFDQWMFFLVALTENSRIMLVRLALFLCEKRKKGHLALLTFCRGLLLEMFVHNTVESNWKCQLY